MAEKKIIVDEFAGLDKKRVVNELALKRSEKSINDDFFNDNVT